MPAASFSRGRPSYAAYAGFRAQVDRRRSKTGCKPQGLPISKHEDRDGKEGGNGSMDLGIGSSSSSSVGSSGDTTKDGSGSSGLSNNVASVLKIELCTKIVDKCNMSPLDDKLLVVTIIVMKAEDICYIKSSIESVSSSRIFAGQIEGLLKIKKFQKIRELYLKETADLFLKNCRNLLIFNSPIEGDIEAVSSNRLAISTILEVQSQGLMLNGIAMESALFDELDSARAVMVSAAIPQFAEESY